MPIDSFHPPERILMGPGPSNVSPRVREAMARPTIGHLDPLFIELMEEIKSLLRYVFQTNNRMTFAVSGTGSAGMEMCFANLVEPGEKVIVCINGVFGQRMQENIIRMGGIPIPLEFEWGKPVDPEKVKDIIKRNPDAKLISFVHAETSTGARSEAEEICKIAKDAGLLTIVDTVTSLGGINVKVDQWGIDACYSGTQKCLSIPPGLAPITFSELAVKKISQRKNPVRSWYLDLNLIMGYWGDNSKRSYHHTAPINSLYGLHEGLLALKEEGLENSWERHQKMHSLLADSLEKIGMKFIVDKKYRLPQLNSVSVPSEIDEAKVRQRLLNEFNLEIGAGLGPLAGKIWRIGLMGHSCNNQSVILCLEAIKRCLT